MSKGKQHSIARGAAKKRRGATRTWLGAEVELIIRERERLLRTAGAAAALITKVNLADFPQDARESVRRLGTMLGALPEETLTDAFEQLLGPRVLKSRVYATS
jgi:hypothetical protein